MKKISLFVFILIVCEQLLICGWKDNLVYKNYEQKDAILFIDDMMYGSTTNIFWRKGSGCLSSYDANCLYSRKQNNLWSSSQFTDMSMYGGALYEDSNADIEFYFNQAQNGFISARDVYSIKYFPNQNKYSNMTLIYSAGSDTSHVWPRKIYIDKTGKKYLFVEIRKIIGGNTSNPLSHTLYYFIFEGSSWSGPHRVDIATDFITENCFCVDEDGELHIIWQELDSERFHKRTVYTKFNGLFWKPLEEIPMGIENRGYHYSMTTYNKMPFLAFMWRSDEEEGWESFYYIIHKDNEAWIGPIKLDSEYFPRDLRRSVYDEIFLQLGSLAADNNGNIHFLFVASGNGSALGLLYTQYIGGEWKKVSYANKSSANNYCETYWSSRIFIDRDNNANIIYSKEVWPEYPIYGYTDLREAIRMPIMPPVNPAISHQENNTIFQREYFDLLSWAKNPENDDQEIAYYNIYIKESSDDSFRFLVQLSSNTFSYTIRNLKNKNSQYAISTIDNYGNESELLYTN